MRYTSFGRHFTKVEKLEEIADRLHWYVHNGDTIVDFCCGSNDFSIIMKKKLEETGKKCYYKNYDIIQPKNDFCFEKRDWMTVQPKELPSGAQLIMGLNPPFGVKAALANQFIHKALQFNPKLLILIVPPETQRLSAYDLIWEDERFLSGKSFYLPGSVDENDKQMDQWNVTAPPLYLWSRPYRSAEYKAIAQKHGHINMSTKSMEDDHSESLDNSVENNDQYGETPMVIDDNPAQTGSSKDFVGGAVASEEPKERSSKGNDERGYCASSACRKNQVNETSARLQCGGRKEHGRGLVELSPDNKCDGRNGSGSEIHKERSPSTEREGKGNQHSEPSNSGSSMQFGTAYGGTAASIPDDTGRKFFMSSDEPYSSATRRWSSGASPCSSYRDTNLEEPVMGYMRERSDTLGYRPYSMEMEDAFRRENDIRAQFRHYGQQVSDPFRSNYLVGQDSVGGQVGSFSSTDGHAYLGSVVDSSYRMNTSAMQRYAPRLDELNHTRTSALGSQPALGYNPPMYHPRAPQPADQGGPFGFAPGSHRNFSNQNSAGWLNE